jgi:hypothetical protein
MPDPKDPTAPTIDEEEYLRDVSFLVTDDLEEQRLAMRKRSGCVNGTTRLVSFLYELLRDHVTIGDVEAIVLQLERNPPTPESPDYFTNGWLARYAEDLAQRLQS